MTDVNQGALVDAYAANHLIRDLNPSTIRAWEARQRLQAQGRDRHGRKLYRVTDILALDRARHAWKRNRGT
jgi:DNA-binding transcriptional MerR regulator